MDIRKCRWHVDTEKKQIIAILPVVVRGMNVDMQVVASTELETAVPKVIQHMTNHMLGQDIFTLEAQMKKDGIPIIANRPNRAERRKAKSKKGSN